MWRTVERKGRIIRSDGKRTVIIPDNFFLEGEEIIIRQEKDGAITIYPAEADAREAMSERFDPFSDWEMDE
jgi:virulence-associated protein VagC